MEKYFLRQPGGGDVPAAFGLRVVKISERRLAAPPDQKEKRGFGAFEGPEALALTAFGQPG